MKMVAGSTGTIWAVWDVKLTIFRVINMAGTQILSSWKFFDLAAGISNHVGGSMVNCLRS